MKRPGRMFPLMSQKKMNDSELKWTVEDSRTLLKTRVFDVLGQTERSGTGLEGDFIAVEAPEWVMVIPELDGKFALVRQWRHGAEAMSIEFPGGVLDEGEDPETAARRELLEETGFRAGKLTLLGVTNPNAALFKNHFHVYLAEELQQTGTQSLDEDEFLNFFMLPVDEVIASFGRREFIHAMMGTALAFYLRHRKYSFK